MKQQEFQQIMNIKGSITFDHVVMFKKQGEELICKGSPVLFDFSDVIECDSSALALLIALKRKAFQKHVSIAFTDLPQSLLALITLCNVASLVNNTYI